MSVELSIYLNKTDLYTNTSEYETKLHPSGFTAYFYKIDPFKGCIYCLDLKREFFTVIHNNFSKNDLLEKWTPKLFDFFNKLSPDKVKELQDKFNSFNFDFGAFEETGEDFSQKDFVNKYKNYFYIQVSEPNSHAFDIKDFRKKLEEKAITSNFNYCDTPETVLLFKDLEIETLNRVLDNIIELRRINNELNDFKKVVTEDYYNDNELWLGIK
jgi:hypothetical protein